MMTRKQLREIIFRHTFYHVADQITDEIYPEMEAMQERINELETAAAHPPNCSEDGHIERDHHGRSMTVSEDGPGNPIDYALYALEEIRKRTSIMGQHGGYPAVNALAYEARKRLQGHVVRLAAETLASGPGKVIPRGTPMARNADGKFFPCHKDDPAKVAELAFDVNIGTLPYIEESTRLTAEDWERLTERVKRNANDARTIR